MEYVLFSKKKFQLKVQNLCSEISTFYLLISEQHDFWVPEPNTPAAIKHILQKTQTQLMNEYWLTLLLLCISALHVRTQHNNCNPSNFHHLQEQDGHVKNSSPRPLPQEEMNIPLRCEVDEGTKKGSFNKHAEANVHLCADKEEMRGKEGRQHVMCSSRISRALRSRYICSTEDAG